MNSPFLLLLTSYLRFMPSANSMTILAPSTGWFDWSSTLPLIRLVDCAKAGTLNAEAATMATAATRRRTMVVRSIRSSTMMARAAEGGPSA